MNTIEANGTSEKEVVEIAKPVRESDTFRVRTEDLIINWAENGRRSEPKIDETFLRSLLYGQLQACVVRKASGGRWKLTIGYRRARHVIEINRRGLLPEPMLLLVRLDKSLNDESGFLANLRENKDRKNTNAADDASNIVRLHELYGWKDKQIGDFYGKTSAWVSKTRKILQLPTKFLDLIEEGSLAAAQAEALVDADDDFREKLYEQLKAGIQISAGDIKQMAREEGASETTRDASLKPKHVVGFFEALADDEDAPEKLREYAVITIKWLRGNTRMSSSKYRSELEERLKLR